MYAYLKGKLVVCKPDYAVLEVGGIGYEFKINLNAYSAIREKERVKLFAYYHKSDHGDALYGFSSEQEKQVFLMLIGVNKIGPSTAQVMLSTFTPIELKQAIINGDTVKLNSIKGIGQKTAQRIIVDLRDKIDLSPEDEGFESVPGSMQEDVVNALLGLGFTKPAITKALNEVRKDISADATVEDHIREALNVLSQ
ncbi:MAG TPA: Holliday junction branch migration protein RuvA [Saprospiraceae bacterium]|nr:Holliday junction branch migration protein RuvA [Saprospiraceae bacterium]